MKYVLLDYVGEAGWPQLTREEQKHWLGAYKAYMEAMTRAGVLKNTIGLQPTATATTVRVANDKPKVLDGPYTDSKEQLGGLHLIEVENLDDALDGRRVRRRRCMALSRYGRFLKALGSPAISTTSSSRNNVVRRLTASTLSKLLTE